MARELWLLRHGEAEPHDAQPDAERRLTPRGERQSRDAGAALARLAVELAAAYTSPRVRALDTARLACEALGAEPEVVDGLSSGWDADGARELLARHEDGAAILAVGHEPDFSQVIHDTTGGRVDLKKGGVAGIRVEGARAELFVLLRPKETEAIASG
jgi:phosphohistidine phosphatase